MYNHVSHSKLWMGTHSKGPSLVKIKSSTKPLLQWIHENPNSMQSCLLEKYQGLPFLFKILSVRKALSIQAHPDKKLAEKLHQRDPLNYPDSNHKPEMTIALTKFEALCGFRPLEEIVVFLKEFSEFFSIVGKDSAEHLFQQFEKYKGNTRQDAIQQLKSCLKKCYSSYMMQDRPTTEKHLTQLSRSIQDKKGPVQELILRLMQQYPNDGGVFNVFFLNYIVLNPGESLYLGANEPHAYISGDCVECMACSDNVVRAGLTPKFKDVPTLCSMLTYNFRPSSELIIKGQASLKDPYTKIYDPPTEEFSIAASEVPPHKTGTLFSVNGPSIAIVVGGHGTLDSSNPPSEPIPIGVGKCFFLPPRVEIRMTAAASSVKIYRAYC
eukprot:Sdes_comp16088_c0_seq2m5293